MHPFAMETAAILVHSINRFSLCTKMVAVAFAKLLLCCDIICKRSIEKGLRLTSTTVKFVKGRGMGVVWSRPMSYVR